MILLTYIQQTVADVVASTDNFFDNGVCVLSQLFFNSLDLTPEPGSRRVTLTILSFECLPALL